MLANNVVPRTSDYIINDDVYAEESEMDEERPEDVPCDDELNRVPRMFGEDRTHPNEL